MLDVIARSHRGRTCKLLSDSMAISTPFVVQSFDGKSDLPVFIEKGDLRRLWAFGEPVDLDFDLRKSYSSKGRGERRESKKVLLMALPWFDEPISDDIEIVIVTNGFELRRDPRRLIDLVVELREKIGYNRLLGIFGIADPSILSLLIYMGVDVFDDSFVKGAGAMGIETMSEGALITKDDPTGTNVEELLRECNKASRFIEAGRLRELVDQRAPSSPTSVALLRLFDKNGYSYQEEACPVVGSKFTCNTPQSLRRADIARYQSRIAERYSKPSHKRVLLLLPCSAKKPYHTSKSHKAFSSAIHTASHDALVHEVIVTSPLGIVPRELDVFFPADSYDIPVTGEWSFDEKEMIDRMARLIHSQGYDKVVCHLGDDYELVKGLGEMTCTVIDDDGTSFESLKNLDLVLRQVTKGMDVPDYQVDRKESMRSILRFQFGAEVADSLLDGGYVLGKFPYWKIMRDSENGEKTQMGMLTPERQMASLTLEGAECLKDAGLNCVEMTDFEIKGNLFAVGVVSADERIRIGDDVAIILNGKVEAVGVAMMSGREMVQLRRGIAVKVRHKRK